MTPPVYQTCMASSAVTDLIGNRLYQDEAEQGVSKPYAVWFIIDGAPENYINQVPDIDGYLLQFDCYAKEQADVEALAKAIRDAVEAVAYIVSWRGSTREKGTRLYRYSFDVEWMVNR